MILLIKKSKKKIIKFFALLLILAVFAAAIPVVSGVLHDKVPVFQSWFADEHPTGNPMRVEKSPEQTSFSKKLDQLVMKVAEFLL